MQIASLYADIGAKTDGFTKGAATVKGGLKDLAGSFAILSTAITVAVNAFEFSRQGAELERLADAGAEVARQFGGNMDTIIQKVKEASHGTVSEMDIIAASNRAMLLGLGADADKLANLMEVAALRGRAMGVDTTKAFSDIVTGIGRASPLILDNLGIVINAKETYDEYAESIGKSSSELTKAEKTQAILNAVLEEGNKMLDEAGGLMVDNTAKVERMNASWKDFTDNRKRENADLAGSFSEAAANAIDGWDEFFTFLNSHTEIARIAQQMARDSGDYSQNAWQKYFEKARVQWVEQKKLIEETTSAVEDNAEAAILAAEDLEILSKANANLINDAINLTKENENYQESQQGILDQIADLQAEKATYYSWETDKIQAVEDKISDLSGKYSENAEDFRAAMEEKFALMAIEQIALSDGVAGYSEAEFEKAKAILETTDVATAAAFEQQQAMTILAEAVGTGRVGVEEYGAILEQVMADGVVSVNEVTSAIDAIPVEKTVTLTVIPNFEGATLSGGLSASPVPVNPNKPKYAHADGGSFIIPQSYGYEGFSLGGMDTASGGERLRIDPQGSMSPRETITRDDIQKLINAVLSTKMDEYALSRIVKESVLQVTR